MDPGPLSGSFSGTIATEAEQRFSFTSAAGGTTNVGVCGPAGADFDITVAGSSGATASNCERVVFQAAAGASYQVVVRAVAGLGPFNGCWSSGSEACAVAAPTVPVPPADVPDTSVYAAARGKTGAELLATLAGIIRVGHRFVQYDRARDSLYDFVEDPDDDNIIQDLYVGRSAFVNSRSTAFVAGLNAEHTWPESCGAYLETLSGTDLHILMPTDSASNRNRSNYPYGRVTGTVFWTSPDVAGRTEHSRQGLDARGRTVFEPRDSRKGDVARALFYWYTRYYADRASTSGFELTNFNIEEPILIQWSLQDPPDAFERARNARVQRAQGNRNPYVDYPGLVLSVGDWPNEGANGPRCSPN